MLVVGFGAAGSTAAHAAREAGAQVSVLERTGGAGGAAALAEGIVYLGGGTPVQRACGFEDSTDEMFKFMMAACGPAPDDAKIAAYCDASLDHFDWLVARGVPFDPSFCSETSMAPTGEEGLVYSGGEDAYPFDRIARPAPSSHFSAIPRPSSDTAQRRPSAPIFAIQPPRCIRSVSTAPELAPTSSGCAFIAVRMRAGVRSSSPAASRRSPV